MKRAEVTMTLRYSAEPDLEAMWDAFLEIWQEGKQAWSDKNLSIPPEMIAINFAAVSVPSGGDQ